MSKKSSGSSRRPAPSAASTPGDPATRAELDAPAEEPAPSLRPAMAAGRSLEILSTPDVCMEMLVDKLKLLDYEREFCRKKKPYRRAINRQYFAQPDTGVNLAQQFFYFTSLAAWLLGLSGVDIPAPKEFDDPNTICANILNACKKLGFAPPSYHPTKLTVGYGRDIVGVLDGLADYALERRNFTFSKPVYSPENYPEEGDVEDTGAEGDEDAATEFPKPKYLEVDEEEAYMQAGANELAGLAPMVSHKANNTQAAAAVALAEDKQMLQSKVDPTAWRLELERVAPRLRILLSADNKDWRSHLEEVQQHSKAISTAWPDSRVVLEKLSSELDASLDKLTSRERFLNEQFERLMAQYRAARVQLTVVQGTYNSRTEAISERNSELHRITEQLTEMKGIMDEHSTNIADATPVVRIRNAIRKLQEELHETEVRIGVVSHTLLQNSLKNKRALQAAAIAMSDDDDDL
ncbi:intra-flagellar transport protein 57 [Haematococcus lacustris]